MAHVVPEVLLSRKYFDKHPDKFFSFYFSNMVFLEAKPNPAHFTLAELEGPVQADVLDKSVAVIRRANILLLAEPL